jgi:hypothetical protein
MIENCSRTDYDIRFFTIGTCFFADTMIAVSWYGDRVVVEGVNSRDRFSNRCVQFASEPIKSQYSLSPGLILEGSGGHVMFKGSARTGARRGDILTSVQISISFVLLRVLQEHHEDRLDHISSGKAKVTQLNPSYSPNFRSVYIDHIFETKFGSLQSQKE